MQSIHVDLVDTLVLVDLEAWALVRAFDGPNLVGGGDLEPVSSTRR